MVKLMSQLHSYKETDKSCGTFLGYEKSILGWFGQPGQYCETKFGADYEQLLRPVFYVFMGKKKFKIFLKIL